MPGNDEDYTRAEGNRGNKDSYERGLAKGREEGLHMQVKKESEAAYERGHLAGYNTGYNHGIDEGFDMGYDEAFASGKMRLLKGNGKMGKGKGF